MQSTDREMWWLKLFHKIVFASDIYRRTDEKGSIKTSQEEVIFSLTAVNPF